MIAPSTARLCVSLTLLALGCEAKTPPPHVHPEEPVPRAADLSEAPRSQAELSTASAVPVATAQAALTRVSDPSLICMVTNQYMGSPQIPIVVEGRSYYGCCEMCKGRLESDPSSRVALDPVSQRPVDKSTAVIGKTSSGRALYFESDRTFAAYTGDSKR